MAKKNWCVPKLTEEFRERMEDVLTLYERPHDPVEPVVCVDEQPYQLLGDVRPAQPASPGRIAKQDYEYRRHGTCAIFVAVEPSAGRRHTWVHARRTKREFAYVVRDLLRRYPRARCVHLVLDNLNTHGLHSLREVFGEARARALSKRLHWHYTPKHASWLNMAEIEISVLTKQCLDRRVPTIDDVRHHMTRWSKERNRQRARIDWTFRVQDARRVFPELYRKKLAG